MMISSVLMVFLTIHMTNSYILLTANLEDVQAIAKQVAASPVADQLNKIWRRAASVFTQQISKAGPLRYQKRAKDEEEAEPNESGPRDQAPPEAEPELEDHENQVGRRQNDEDLLVALGKNASLYLKSIRKIFEHVK